MSKRSRRSKKRSHQGAGRPRKEGDRHPSGELKRLPEKPNENVLQRRRAMLGVGDDQDAGALTQAENPLDLMLARKWITEDQHRAAADYADLYSRSRLPAPSRGVMDLERVQGGAGSAARAPEIPKALREIWRRCSPQASQTLTEVCVHQSWPQWVIWLTAGKPVPAHWDVRRLWLISGLEHVRAVVKSRPQPKNDDSPSALRGHTALHFGKAS